MGTATRGWSGVGHTGSDHRADAGQAQPPDGFALAELRDLLGRARFPTCARGYEAEAVDVFISALRQRVDTIIAAQEEARVAIVRDADHLWAEAARHAVLTRLEARARADAILLDAQARADEMVAKAERTATAAPDAWPPAPRPGGGSEDRIMAVALEAIGAIAEMADQRSQLGPGRESRRLQRLFDGSNARPSNGHSTNSDTPSAPERSSTWAGAERRRFRAGPGAAGASPAVRGADAGPASGPPGPDFDPEPDGAFRLADLPSIAGVHRGIDGRVIDSDPDR